MNCEKEWRFPNNDYGQEYGLDTGDIETFKKDPDAALARETCQNSIDAQFGDTPTRVEFKLFEINRNEIPGIERLTEEIEKCYEFKKDSEKEEKPLRALKNAINSNTITCLRISDFNTTGLLGVRTNDRKMPFYNLTKGSGVSDKEGTSGGSKGIGKFASFVASTTNTVFYSTKTKDNEVGHLGITKLRSTPVNEDEDDLLTIGVGYYGLNKKNYPILNILNLDNSFCRENASYGTDIFVIGFNNNKTWINDIVAKVLESFMAAIILNNFEVEVENVVINKDSLYDLIYNSDILTSRNKTEIKGIKAQYELLTDENVKSKKIDIGENSYITVYVKQYNSKYESEATKQCIMIRYPYMKIKHTSGHSYLPYSALCIIHDNELNKKLRIIENPQHTDWEIKRLNDYPNEKKTTFKLRKEMYDKISEYIKEVLHQSESESTDVDGAGDYLPSPDDEGVGDGVVNIKDDVTISKAKTNLAFKQKTEAANEEEDGYEFDFGKLDIDEDEIYPPEGDKKSTDGGNGYAPKDDIDGGMPGKDPVLSRIPLGGMRYKNIVIDKENGKFDVVFTSLYDEDNCELLIKMCGEGNEKFKINILNATINGHECKVDNSTIKNIRIEKNKKYKISYTTDMKELFASEVILNAYR